LNPYLDRGWALQEAWRRQLLSPQTTLWDWRAQVAGGHMPAPLLDATAVETGRQVLITPIDVHRAGNNRFHAYHNFLGLYAGRDLDTVTAARLSATFPWVTPIARSSPASGGPPMHVADGAYVDNYGVATMVEWLNTILPTYVAEQPTARVLVIRINIRDAHFSDALQYEPKEGWAYTVYGPLLTMLNAGSASQVARNQQLLDLLTQRWQSGAGVPIEVVDFVLRTEVPLSWQLTDDHLAQIRGRWAEELEGGTAFARVKAFYE
jgi:hypothetical protein